MQKYPCHKDKDYIILLLKTDILLKGVRENEETTKKSSIPVFSNRTYRCSIKKLF